MKKFSTKAKRKIRADIRQPKSLLRVESLEARTLLSVEPIANAVVDGGDDTACIVLAAPLERREEINPICVDAAVLSNTVEISEVVASCVASEQWGALQEVFENYEGDPSSEDDELLIIESVDFDAETVDDSTLSLGAEREEGGMRSGGGGSGGGNLITPHFSGDGIEYNGGYLITEGVNFLITFTGGSVGDVVSATITHVGTNADDLRVISNTATIGVPGNNSAIEITAVQDDLLEELDETFTVNLAVTNGSSTLTQSSFTITIMWRPEFDSLPDYNLSQDVVNDDYYRACVDSDAASNAGLTYRQKEIAVLGGTVNGSGRVKYSIVQNSNSPTDPSNFFRIDEDTGLITLRQKARNYIIATYGNYECDLQIRAENKNYLGISGGAPADVANVHVTFSHWDIQRNNGFLAAALPSDGASISLLSQTVGLLKDEFEDWLTFNPQTRIELFDGTLKCASEITPDDLLAATSFTAFAVPNVIFAAYCLAPSIQNGTPEQGTICWSDNIQELTQLGFYVHTFENYRYNDSSNTEMQNAALALLNILNPLSFYSTNKCLHGIYLVSHGNREGFGPYPSSNNNGDSGPYWNLPYRIFDTQHPSYDPSDVYSWSIEATLHYHLGALVLVACQSDYDASYLCSTSVNTSSGGLKYCYPGDIGLRYYQAAHLWHLSPGYYDGYNEGGAQGTRRFLR